MRKVLSLISLLTLLLPCLLFSQEYSYTHYDINDGLAGSTVYCITQDKDGFIWLGTETGVSRFDGTHFRTFSTEDGLPDVEILEMFGDSRGRVWMAPFQKTICYYYQGQIHNQTNDSVLRRLRIRNNIYSFAGDSAGNVLAATTTELYLIRPDGTSREIDSVGGRPIHDCGAVSTSADGHFLVQVDKEIYRLSGNDLTPLSAISIWSSWPVYVSMNSTGMIWWEEKAFTAIHSFATGKTVRLHFERGKYEHNTFTSYGDSLFWFNENSGVREYNPQTGRIRRLMPGKPVSRTFRDATGNLWFTTLGQGIYRLNSDEFQTINVSSAKTPSSAIYGIRRLGDQLLAGNDQNQVIFFRLPDLSVLRIHQVSQAIKIRIYDFGMRSDGKIYVPSTRGINIIKKDILKEEGYFHSIKSYFPLGNDKVLIASFWGAGILDLKTFHVEDTLYRDRTTTVYYRRDTVLIGTLNGLYGIAPDRSIHFYGDKVPFLRKRISALTESADGTLWVASYDAGIIGYRNGEVVAALSKPQGLTSNICRVLYFHKNALWVGTDKGLTRIALDRPGYPMHRYTSQDGLGSDLINSVYGDGSVIYVGTSAGLSFFDENRVNVSEGCRLHLLSIQNSDRERLGDSAALVLPYADKHLRLEFAGISYRSVGDITYRYRLIGLDSIWRTTKQTFLEYPTLPSGNYAFQLQASNKFGLKSDELTLRFEVATPWWQTIWFDTLALVTVLSLSWFFVSLRIRRIRRRQREKEKLNQRMMELEHLALQSQMNPHFIFNCLNSIQQYVFDQDVFATNKYLTGFSKLIRATLQYSTRNFIHLSEEVSYLSGYLSLEKLRFKEKMDYTIEVDPALQTGEYLVPPMLIQPYVENSMRHGLRHKTQGKGTIRISFRQDGARLIAVVEDNGIGRKGAAAFKTREHIEYQSKGMSLTADRIRMINARFRERIDVEIVDLEDDAGNPAGTRVVMEFPLFHSISENEPI
ncbi:sensor histidine kinase [Puia sp.]|jgi:hypothetical protein|uniref:sensor histidine kinase n=1 Tax=Puia sp. TaxID=2045100 RepID=UPI002F3E3CEC